MQITQNSHSASISSPCRRVHCHNLLFMTTIDFYSTFVFNCCSRPSVLSCPSGKCQSPHSVLEGRNLKGWNARWKSQVSRNSKTTDDVTNWLSQYIWYIKCKTTIFYISLAKKQRNDHDCTPHNWPFVLSLALLVCCAMIFLYQIFPKELFHEHLIYYILIVDRIFWGNQEFSDIKGKENQEVLVFLFNLSPAH